MIHVNVILTCFFAGRSERYLGTCHSGMEWHWWQSRWPEGRRLSVYASSSLFFPAPRVMCLLLSSHKNSKCGRSAGATCLQSRGLNAPSYQLDGWLCDAQGPDKPSPTHQIIFAPPRSPTHQPPSSSTPLTKNKTKQKHRHTLNSGETEGIFLYLKTSFSKYFKHVYPKGHLPILLITLTRRLNLEQIPSFALVNYCYTNTDFWRLNHCWMHFLIHFCSITTAWWISNPHTS